MKLALVSGEFPPQQGGVGDYTREMAREFARRGIAVRVISSAVDPATQQGSAANEQYTVHYTHFASWRSLLAVDALSRDCDFVHIQYQAAAYGMTPPIHLLPRYLRWRRPRRLVAVTFHDLRIPYLFPKAGPLRWRAILYLAASADIVIVTNQEDLQTLSTDRKFQSPTPQGGRLAVSNPTRSSPIRHARLQSDMLASVLCRSPISLIPIGSNIDATAATPSDRASTRASLGIAAADVVLCYFGFLSASKGGETLVRALAEVARAGHPARLLMLGGETGASDPTNAAYAQKVKALIAELGLAERVIWAGYRPSAEVTSLWHASDIAVLPYADGVSLRRGTLMAALAHAMPIVSTTPRVPIAQLRDGENILLAPPGDVAALACRVTSLIESPELRRRLALAAGALAQEFTWPHIVDQHLDLYRQYLAR